MQQQNEKSFVLVNQEALSKENFLDNGNIKQVYCVVKEKQFVVIVSSSFDLRKTQLSCKLVYDFEEPDQPQEVLFARNPPIEYRDSQGTKATIDLKIKVLTSQHEDMLFRVIIQSLDFGTSVLHAIISHPIRVVSKPALLKNKMPKSGRKITSTKRALDNPDSESTLQHKIQHLEQQQKEQQQILQELSQRGYQDVFSFDLLFGKFLAAFSAIPQEQRDLRIKQAISTKDFQHLC